MPRYFVAGEDHAIEIQQDMDPFHKLAPGAGVRSGLMRAYVTVHDPGEECSPTLPTLRGFLEKHIDAATGLLSYNYAGPTLTMDPAPLRALPPQYLECRVSPGASFITHEALARAASARSI